MYSTLRAQFEIAERAQESARLRKFFQSAIPFARTPHRMGDRFFQSLRVHARQWIALRLERARNELTTMLAVF